MCAARVHGCGEVSPPKHVHCIRLDTGSIAMCAQYQGIRKYILRLSQDMQHSKVRSNVLIHLNG